MNTPWSELPNAHHIDWVINAAEQNSHQLWNQVWPAMFHVGIDNSDWDAAWRKAWENTVNKVGKATWNAADIKVNAASKGEQWLSTRCAVLALVAYDDCDQYINMGYEKLLVYAALSKKPQAVLLLPMVYVREKLNERMVALTLT